jgi:hypothetical protein
MARKQASYVPAVKPARGVTVALDGKPGTWQISDKAPERGSWWLVALDAAAKAHASFAKATAQEMNRPQTRTS